MQSWDFLNGGLDEWTKKNPQKPGVLPGTSSIASAPPGSSAPASTFQVTPGYTPDYKNLILSAPSYLAWKNNANLDVSQAASQRAAALKAMAMQYGGVGPGFQDSYGDLDPATLELAKGNQFSDLARLNRSYDDNVLATKRSLAARGALQSGELGYGLDRAALAKATSEYDLGQQFGSAARSAIDGYLGVEAAARRGEAGALTAAGQEVYANPNNRAVEATSGTLDPEWQKYGFPVYVGSDGRRWRVGADGKPEAFTPPAPAPVKPVSASNPTGGMSLELAKALLGIGR